MVKCKEYRAEARAALRGNWGMAVVATLVVGIIALLLEAPSALDKTSLSLVVVPSGIALFIMMNLECGYANAFRYLYERGDTELLGNTFNLGFQRYFRILGGMLLVALIIFCGFLLFIIPGFILAYAYSMVPFLLVDEPDLSVGDCLRKSRQMMKGHKLDLFILQLSFLGWILLAVCFTLCIGLFWVAPYMETAQAVFYVDLKNGTAGVPSEAKLSE